MTKARQSSKIRELGDALVTAGFVMLDEQAQAIGLCRSTTWTILKGNHKTSGPSATVINRMLAAPQLPPLVRQKILEYIEENVLPMMATARYHYADLSLVCQSSLPIMSERNWSRNIMRQKTNFVTPPDLVGNKLGPSGIICGF